MQKNNNIIPSRSTAGALATVFSLTACSPLPVQDVDPAVNIAGSECPTYYTNPIIWEDLPDPEIIRVDDTYYYTASSFHHVPGAPLLRSYDLVHWEYLSHSVPRLDADSAYDLERGRAYVDGIWASTLQYRKSNETFYWLGCMHDVGGGQMFTATDPEGPWEGQATEECYYDMGLLIDDDDTLYVAWGNDEIFVAQLAADGRSEVRRQQVLDTPAWVKGPLEGARFKKINGDYYIFLTQYANGEYVLRSTDGPFGPYELRPFAVGLPFARADAGEKPHQGGLIETQHGNWYYMAFNDAFPGGRIPVMAPVTWADGWPEVTLVEGQWGASYPFPDLPCGVDKVKPYPAKDLFATAELGPVWEWNHNPDNAKWQVGDGLVLQTASVTEDLFAARNTLTRRIQGPRSVATVELDYRAMRDGDIAGLAAFRDLAAWVGVTKVDGQGRIVMRSGQALGPDWNTVSLGREIESKPIRGGTAWLRMEADIRTTDDGGTAVFSWSDDGIEFQPIGEVFTMKRAWNYFLGYRFGLFNYATEQLGGRVTIKSFEVSH